MKVEQKLLILVNSTLWTTHYDRDPNSTIIPMNFFKDIPFGLLIIHFVFWKFTILVPPIPPRPITPSTITSKTTPTSLLPDESTADPPIQNPRPGDDGYESAGKRKGEEDSDVKDENGCSFFDECISCFIALGVTDVILIILLIILIILARRGSKKMKAAAMAKQHRKSESTVGTTVGTTVAASQIKSHKKKKNKHKKKSETETGTTVGGQTDGDEVSKAASKVSGTGKHRGSDKKHETPFYTVDSYFQPSSKSKKKKSKK